MPWDSRAVSRAVQDGSTPELVNPFSASYPMWATCLKEPWVGPEIMALSIFPPLLAFFLEEEDALALAAYS